MPFVTKIPTRVEDLFVHVPPGNDAFMEAVLQDGTKLYLSDGFGNHYPSPWPLYLHSRLAPPGALRWMEETLAATIVWLEEASSSSLKDHPEVYRDAQSFFGPYLNINGLEVGVRPSLYRSIASGPDWRMPKTKDFRMDFDSPIVAFNPLAELPDNYPTP